MKKYVTKTNIFYVFPTDEPVDPVEDGPELVVGGAADEGEEGLDEAETHGDEADDGVGVGGDGLADVPQLEQDEDEARHGEAPGDHHEGPVPDEPLVQVEASL